MPAPAEPVPGGAAVEAAVEAMLGVLGPRTPVDWRRPRAGALAWSCRETVVHVAHDLLAYAAQVAGSPPQGYLPLDLSVRDEASNREVLAVVSACGRLLAAAVTSVPGDSRAWHWGPTDPGGFAALGVNETLVHTGDVARGLGLTWRPPAALCRLVLSRLFPDAPDGDEADVLLWSTGRATLGDRPPPASWTLRAARG